MEENTRSRDAVIALPELLLLILSKLHPRDLLQAQRVCKKWQKIIASQALQRNLFFVPETSEDGDGKTTICENPLLSAAFGFLQFPDCSSFYHGFHLSEGFLPFAGHLPWVTRTEVISALNNDESNARPSLGSLGQVLARHFADETRRQAFLRPDASWRRMLTHQPPILLVEGIRHSEGSGGIEVARYRRECSEGLQMGWLYDTVQEWAGQFCEGGVIWLALKKVDTGRSWLRINRSERHGCEDLDLTEEEENQLEIVRQAKSEGYCKPDFKLVKKENVGHMLAWNFADAVWMNSERL